MEENVHFLVRRPQLMFFCIINGLVLPMSEKRDFRDSENWDNLDFTVTFLTSLKCPEKLAVNCFILTCSVCMLYENDIKKVIKTEIKRLLFEIEYYFSSSHQSLVATPELLNSYIIPQI
jgi:hypothetical protein